MDATKALFATEKKVRRPNGLSRIACMYDTTSTETINVNTCGQAIRDDSLKSVYLGVGILAAEHVEDLNSRDTVPQRLEEGEPSRLQFAVDQ